MIKTKRYLAGTARSLRTRKITITNASANANMPGRPISSAKPVFGNAVEVAITVSVVCVEAVEAAAIWVNAAPTVAVAGFEVGEAVTVAWAITGVFVGATVFVTAAAWVSAWLSAFCVSPAAMVAC